MVTLHFKGNCQKCYSNQQKKTIIYLCYWILPKKYFAVILMNVTILFFLSPSHIKAWSSGYVFRSKTLIQFNIETFPVCLRNQLFSAGLEPVICQTEKSCIALYFILIPAESCLYYDKVKSHFQFSFFQFINSLLNFTKDK